MVFSLEGKVAIVTGGGSGIGLAVSTILAGQGAAVQILDVGAEAAQEAAKKIGGKTHGMQCDVSSQAAVNACFDEVVARCGSIDILVNNAGIASVGTVMEATEADMDRVYAVNVKGSFFCLQAAVKAMLRPGASGEPRGGAIVNLASIASIIGLADRFVYSMSKGAVLTMTYSVATDYVKKNIRCNCVCPGRIHTPFVDGYLAKSFPTDLKARETKFRELSDYQPVGRMGKPEEVAHMILYLVSDEAKFTTGAAFSVDGGVAAKM